MKEKDRILPLLSSDSARALSCLAIGKAASCVVGRRAFYRSAPLRGSTRERYNLGVG